MLEQIKKDAATAITELLAVAKLKKGDIIVIGCSSSEIVGEHIGKGSSMEAAEAVFGAVYPIIKKNGLYLAVQCCEHLNRSLITERECLEKYGLTEVNVVPHAHAGGAFATTAYANFDEPCAVERMSAKAGIDIGDTLIGMHIIPVCVPVRISIKKIGEANLVLARHRPKFVGGERARYNEELM